MMKLLLVASALVLVACSEPDAPHDPLGQCGEETKVIPMEINRDIDLLFVIDNSPSMADEQANLQTNFAQIISVLENIEGDRPNLHIGVVSTDVGVGSSAVAGCTTAGDDGRMLGDRTGDCPGLQGNYLVDVANYDGTRSLNFDSTLTDAFSCIAMVGTSGCEFSQPLEAMRRALSGGHPENQGFLRPDAFLMVVFLTDQDDCSAADDLLFDPDAETLGPLSTFRCFAEGVVCSPDQPQTAGTHTGCAARDDSAYFEPLQNYVDFLHQVVADPHLVAVVAADGPSEPVVVGFDEPGSPTLGPSCQSAHGEGRPAIRLSDFLARFPQRNLETSICSPDLYELMVLIAQSLATTMPLYCLEGTIDLDPETPGLQVDCVVSDILGLGTADEQEILLRRCDQVPPPAGSLPCWTISDEPNCSDTPTGSELELHRGPVSVPHGTYTLVRCSTGCSYDAGPGD